MAWVVENHFSRKTTQLSDLVNMAAEVPVTQAARASTAAMNVYWYIPVPAPKELVMQSMLEPASISRHSGVQTNTKRVIFS